MEEMYRAMRALEPDAPFSRASLDRSTISGLRAQVVDLEAENNEHREGKVPEAWRLDTRRIERERDMALEAAAVVWAGRKDLEDEIQSLRRRLAERDAALLRATGNR